MQRRDYFPRLILPAVIFYSGEEKIIEKIYGKLFIFFGLYSIIVLWAMPVSKFSGV